MATMTQSQYSDNLKKLRTDSKAFANLVQEMLVSAAFFAFKDGNCTPFNQMIEAVGPGTHLAGITRWIELVAGIGRVKEGKIVLNKKVREDSGVIDEKTFAPFEEEMRKVMWHDTTPRQKAESVFDEGSYMKRVLKKLTDQGFGDLADALKQAELAWLVKHATSKGNNATAEAGTPAAAEQ